MPGTLVKICGITSAEEGVAAAESGADFVGFVFAASRRQVTPRAASLISRRMPAGVQKVGVFVDSSVSEVLETCAACGLGVAQIHGQETPELAEALRSSGVVQVWKALRVRSADDLTLMEQYLPCVDGILLDAYSPCGEGGTGARFDWSLAENARRPGIRLILAGGLDAGNVGRAIDQVRPDVVDVSTGVESSPGRKDVALVRAFIRAAKQDCARRQDDLRE
jgi:phosphoribosylanthranilate isomerase